MRLMKIASLSNDSLVLQPSGGLGNQVFSFATAWSYAQRHRRILLIDDSIYTTSYGLKVLATGHDQRYLELHRFHLPMNFDESEIVFSSFYSNRFMYNFLQARMKYQENLISNLRNVYVYQNLDELEIPNRSTRIYGNFLSLNDLDKACEIGFDIASKIALPINFVEFITSNEIVHIHMRFGDFFKTLPHFRLNSEYYLQALKLLSISDGSVPVVIYSDSESEARRLLQNVSLPLDVYLASDLGITNLETQFMALKQAKRKIISNSSFSVSAARLGFADKFVIAPSTLGRLYGRYTKSDNWKEIDA